MKIKSFILSAIFAVILVSCEKDMKWINEYDPEADSTEIADICKEKAAECGKIEIEFNGKGRLVFCGECKQEGYKCGPDNKCADIDECADSSLNDCHENSDCHNLDTKSDGKPYECICKENYSGDNCDPDTRTKDCVNLPENAEWNSVSEITQTWNGSGWSPANEGTFNKEASETECHYKCKKNYTWDGIKCKADTKKTNCEGLPENTVWNTASEINQTWNGEEWVPSAKGTYNEESSTKECRFKCDTNYNWSASASKCVAATKESSCTGLPQNATWNTVSSITQTWSGSEWLPGTTGTWNTAASTKECRFKCNEHYNWNSSNKTCDAATQPETCSTKPANTVWNDGGANGTFTQTWSDSGWTPASYASEYGTEEGICHYKCDSTHTWESGNCINQKTATCPDKPENTVWNDSGTNGTFNQNWDSSNGWTPNYTSAYSTTPGICKYKCDSTHTWENGSCINQKSASCSAKPANTVWNDNGANGTFTQSWNDSNGWIPLSYSSTYDTTPGVCRFKCKEHYKWNSSTLTCDAETQQAECSAKPANSVWNDNGENGTFTQTWTDSGWAPASYTSEYSTTAGVCKYKCDSTHTWENGSCINQKSASCSAKPENTVWNDNGANGMFTQNWSSSNGWTPASYTSTYNTTAGICRYKCDSTHTWENGSCINQKTASCSTKPANTVWNDNGANGMFTQNWSNSNGWTPASYTSSYSTTAGTCRYKCDSSHFWYNSECSSPCDHEPCEEVTNSTHVCSATSWQDYSCECNSGYFWNGEKCKRITLGNICTGENTCYNLTVDIMCPTSSSDDFFGQDAYYASLGTCIPQSFEVQTISSQKVVLDNNTGLMWQQTIQTKEYTWSDAVSYCSGLTYAGYSDWRLPTPQELLTIVDNSKESPAIDTTYFPNMPSPREFFWSSSTSDHINYIIIDAAWIVTFGLGFTTVMNKSDSSYVRCVRGNELPTSTFSTLTINGDVIVTDTKSGLVWQKTYETGKKWQQALDYCENLTYAGYDDWRLPNKNELASLVNYEKYDPASDFPNISSNNFCSSSSTGSSYAYSVSFAYGHVDNHSKTSNCYVRCVR